MNAYIFNAALYCEDCARKAIDQLTREGFKDSGDSDQFPQGPYSNGGGESDSPEHCDQCGIFLENPLTIDGYQYIRECISDYQKTGHGNKAALKEWYDFYYV